MAKYVSDRVIIDALKQAGFTSRADVITGLAVSLAESGSYDYKVKMVRANAEATHTNKNGSIDYGAWQINTINADVFEEGMWSDVYANARMAFRVHKRQGWNAWSVIKNGRYANYMNRATRAFDNPNDNRFVLSRYLGVEKPMLVGSDVEEVQKVTGNPVMDGYYGVDTERYVKAFQKSKGLIADGIVGPMTAKKMEFVWDGPVD